MKTSLARHYLLRALAMKRKKRKELRERVKAGQCIIDGCDRQLGSRGLCNFHRQQWYREVRKQDSPEAKFQFEERSIALGLILAPGEQDEWTRDNPFAEAAG